jgi:hypothetical protein
LNLAVKSIVTHNRNLFWSSKRDRIQDLFDRLTKDSTCVIM